MGNQMIVILIVIPFVIFFKHIDNDEHMIIFLTWTYSFFFFFQSYLEQAHIDKVEGAFSTVDVDSVDMYKFPGLQTIPYYKVLMEPGDCLFIPSR